MKIDFKTKRLILVLSTSFCISNFVSCAIPRHNDKESMSTPSEPSITSISDSSLTDVTFSPVISSSDETVITSSDASSSETEFTEPHETTQHIDNVGDIIVSNPKYIEENEFKDIFEKMQPYGFISLGYDNPTILEFFKNYYNDESITMEDIGFCQPKDLNDSIDFIDASSTVNRLVNQGFFVQFGRYFLSLNNSRLWIDDIKTKTTFLPYFPEYKKYFDEGRKNDLYNEMFSKPYILDLINGCSSEGEAYLKKFMQNDSPDAHEAMKFYIFFSLMDLNDCRFNLASTYSTVIGFIPVAESTDGYYILAPASNLYSKLSDITHSIPLCEELDISKPETYEDLVNSGVDVELLEKAFKYAGLDIPFLSETYNKADESGARIRKG